MGMPEFMRARLRGECPTCGELVSEHDFTDSDERSQIEYRLSGMCQACQDHIFQDLEEDED
jgi:hypothetical protein